jgi:CheY-like chemotaxis protein
MRQAVGGTTFSFERPVPQNAVGTSGKYRILVVEDDPLSARHMLTALSRAGLECRHAPDGRVCLEALENEEFHLVLLDLGLPEINGNEICRRIRSESTLPVIIVTAQEGFDVQMQYFRLGADDYLTKPFSPQNLVLRVMTLLRRTYIYGAEPREEVSNHHAGQRAAPTEEIAAPKVPGGWARCDVCAYMGPIPRFETQDANGQHIMLCPHCGHQGHIAYALGP